MSMLTHRYEGEVLVVHCQSKRIDDDVAIAFRVDMAALLELGVSRIVLNLSHVEFIDSSGLGALISIIKRLGRDGTLILCCVQHPVMSMFRMTRMDKVFQITETEGQALLRSVA